MNVPEFPQFKPLDLEDGPILHDLLRRYQPETSELTFTNFFIWRRRYEFQWSIHKDWLLVVSLIDGQEPFAFPPLGPGPRHEPVRAVLQWLKKERGAAAPHIERADPRIVSEVTASGEFLAEPARADFDYVYRTSDLIDLAGAKYHGKRNHIARFAKAHAFSYARLDDSHVVPCLDLAEAWCSFKRCKDDMDLMDEWDAVKDALAHYRRLNVRGGVILLKGKVEAFALGELLNDQTAVVHIEKANPKTPGLYAVINREFCRNEWSGVPFINREQDLGEEGLRKAKLSYHPARLVEKFTIRPAGAPPPLG
jgi:hypothetical protein